MYIDPSGMSPKTWIVIRSLTLIITGILLIVTRAGGKLIAASTALMSMATFAEGAALLGFMALSVTAYFGFGEIGGGSYTAYSKSNN